MDLDRVRAKAGPYPVHLLEGCEDGLLLFGAAFLGANDGVHFLDAGLRSVVVDIDEPKLLGMEKLYPVDWSFIPADAWDITGLVGSWQRQWDAVSVDSWRGDLEDRSLHSLELWCSLARKFVTVTLSYGSSFVCPVGWTFSLMPRSGNARWLILERDAS